MKYYAPRFRMLTATGRVAVRARTSAKQLRASTPAPSSESVSQRMRRVRTSDTAPELRLRRTLHKRGLRYRINSAPFSGAHCKADLVFRSAKVAVFVDGCFWHGCPQHASWPKANADWWRAKIELTRKRDQEAEAVLGAAGWAVHRVWEHEDVSEAADRIERLIRSHRPG